MRTEGIRLLSATGLDHATIASELGVSRQAVQQWLSGEKKPGTARRAGILQRYGVPEAAWDTPVAGAMPEPVEPPDAGESKFDAEARLRAQLARLDALRKAGGDLPPAQRMRLESTETKCIELLGKMTGEGQEIGESRIVRLPAWRRIQESVISALRPWPAAAAAVVKALKEFGS